MYKTLNVYGWRVQLFSRYWNLINGWPLKLQVSRALVSNKIDGQTYFIIFGIFFFSLLLFGLISWTFWFWLGFWLLVLDLEMVNYIVINWIIDIKTVCCIRKLLYKLCSFNWQCHVQKEVTNCIDFQLRNISAFEKIVIANTFMKLHYI